MNRPKTLLPAAIATLALVLAGCGESAEDSGTPSAPAGGGGAPAAQTATTRRTTTPTPPSRR